MTQQRTLRTIGVLAIIAAWALPTVASDVLPDSDLIMRAMADELARSMQLQMEDLEKPYFIQYSVEDSITYQISAAYGALVASARDRSRTFYGQIRVGSYELDNTNFTSGGGGFFFGGGSAGGSARASLPLDDDYSAIRQAIKVMDALDRGKDHVELEDAEWHHLKVALREFKWAFAAPAIIEMVDDVMNAVDPDDKQEADSES